MAAKKKILPCGQFDNGFGALPRHRVEDGDVSGGDEYPAAVDEHPGDAEGRLAPTPNVVEDKEASTETLRQKEPKYQSHTNFRLWENFSYYINVLAGLSFGHFLEKMGKNQGKKTLKMKPKKQISRVYTQKFKIPDFVYNFNGQK